MSTSLPSHIPEALTQEISRVVGHDDYAPYVLDGQSTAGLSNDGWHDVLVIIDADSGIRALKFVQNPEGHIEHHEIQTQVTVRG